MADLSLRIALEALDRATEPLRRVRESLRGLDERAREATRRVRGLEGTARDLDAFRKLKEKARANSEAMKDLRARMETASAEAARLGRETGGTGKKFRAAQEKVRTLREEQQRLIASTRRHNDRLKALRERLGKAGVETRRMAEEQRRLRREIEDATQAAQRQADRLRQLDEARARMRRTRQMAGSLAMGGAAGMAAGGAGLYAGARLAEEGISFGAAMSRVGALARVDEASEAFAQLRETARRLGAETTFSATQAAEGMGYLAMAGFDANQTMAAMPGMLKLAQAGGMELAETADIASNILSGFRLKAEDMGRVGDVLAATFTRSNVDLRMLGETMKYTAPIAAELGMSVEEAAALTGLLGNVGIQGSEAGTALRAIQNRLAAPPKMAAEALERLKIETKDAEGNMRPLVDILGEVAAKTEGMGSADRMGLFKAIAGQEAGSAFAQLVNDQGAGAIEQFVAILRQAHGELDVLSDRMTNNTAGDLKKLSSAWADLKIELFEGTESPLRGLIQDTTEMIGRVTAWAKANPELMATIVKVTAVTLGLITAFGGIALGIASVLGPFAILRFAVTSLGMRMGGLRGIMGGTGQAWTKLTAAFQGARSILGPGLRGAVRGLGIALRGVGTAARLAAPIVVAGIRAISAALLANPILAIIAAIAGAAYLIYRNWDSIGPWFGRLWDGIKGTASAAWEGITGAASAAWDTLKGATAAVWDALKATVSWSPIGLIVTHWSEIKTAIGNALQALPDLAATAWDGLKTALSWSPLGLIAEHWEPIVAWFQGLWDRVTGAFREALAFIKDTLGVVSGAVQWVGDKLGLGGGDADAGGGSPASTATPPLAIIPTAERAAVAARTSARSAAPVTVNRSYTINVSGTGLNPDQIAALIRREIDALDRRRAVSDDAGGALYDGAL